MRLPIYVQNTPESSRERILYRNPERTAHKKSRVCPTGIAALRERMARPKPRQSEQLFYKRNLGCTIAVLGAVGHRTGHTSAEVA